MKTLSKYMFAVVLLATVAPQAAHAWDGGDRTANRSLGRIFYPQWILNVPEHYEFSPLVSNNDPHHQHPAQWAGQDWDTAKWSKDWTPEVAVKNFFAAHIFSAQYIKDQVPVLEMGPRFYELSDLDRRRTLKLVSDYTQIFGKGHKFIQLRDWYTKDIVGTYTPGGMYLK